MGVRKPLTTEEQADALRLFRLLRDNPGAPELTLQSVMRVTRAQLRRLLAALDSCVEQEPGTLHWRLNDHPIHAPICFNMLFGYSMEAEFQERRITRYRRAIAGAHVYEDTIADTLWLREHPEDANLAWRAANPDIDPATLLVSRWLLIEESVRDGEWFVTDHDNPHDAREYHDNQEYPEEWNVVKLLDLDTGRELVAQTRTITEFVEAP